jgi:hypothetical protein
MEMKMVLKEKGNDSNLKEGEIRTYFKRPCTKCGKDFIPTGKYQKLCPRCRYLSNKNRNLKRLHMKKIPFNVTVTRENGTKVIIKAVKVVRDKK